MKDTKRRVEFFSFYDHTGIEAHLERMAAEGWLLEKIGNFTWHYRRVEPQKLTFCVSYFPRASLFDPEPSAEQETFYDFCQHTGWTLAAASAQMQVFYNQRPNPVPIDTDPAMEVEAIHKSAKRSFLLPQGLLLVMAVMNTVSFLWQLSDDPIAVLSSPLHLFSLVCWPLLILLIGADFATYFRWRRRALKAAAQGEFLATRSHPVLQKTALAVVLAGLVWCLSCLRGGMLTMMVAALLGTLGVVFIVVQIRELLKQKKVSKDANLMVTYGACVILTFLMLVLVLSFVFGMDQSGWRDRGSASDELPLTLDDLIKDPGDLYQSVNLSQSPLLAVLTADQYLRRGRNPGDPAPHWLRYSITEVKAPFLYDVCKNQMLTRHDTRGNDRIPEGEKRWYEPAGPAPWGAVEAYEEYFQNPAATGHTYLLCYPGRIVEIDFDWEPTPEQIALTAEKLGGARPAD